LKPIVLQRYQASTMLSFMLSENPYFTKS
jgi:hypothetical protein